MTRPPLLLALDTCTSYASVALYNGQVLSETTWRAGREHSSRVLEEVDRALARVGCRPSDLSAVAAARGPGSFAGVRVGVALARGLSFALDIPAYGVGSLEVLAAAQELSPLPVRPLLEAGRGRFATALFERGPRALQQRGSLQVITLDDLPSLVQTPTLLCGDLWGAARQRVSDLLGPLAVLPSPAASPRRAGYLAELAWARLQSGQPPAPEELEPIYLGGQTASGQ